METFLFQFRCQYLILIFNFDVKVNLIPLLCFSPYLRFDLKFPHLLPPFGASYFPKKRKRDLIRSKILQGTEQSSKTCGGKHLHKYFAC